MTVQFIFSLVLLFLMTFVWHVYGDSDFWSRVVAHIPCVYEFLLTLIINVLEWILEHFFFVTWSPSVSPSPIPSESIAASGFVHRLKYASRAADGASAGARVGQRVRASVGPSVYRPTN